MKAMKEVSFEDFKHAINNYEGELSIDHSFLHEPPAVIYWDFTQPKESQFIGKKYQDEDINRKPIGMKYFVREDLSE